MRRPFLAVITLALLASSGAGAVSCVYDVPAATVLLPYFRVSLNGAVDGPIPEGGRDTFVSLTNTGETGVVVHATIWNKYGKPVLSFNVPMAAFDVAFFRMKDVLNGRLNVNPNVQNPARLPNDPCGLNVASGLYSPKTGFAPSTFIRFANPDSTDAARATSIYAVPAFDPLVRTRLWDSLDESGDVDTTSVPTAPNVLDVDNPACGVESDGRLEGDLTGYATFDVVNYCTTRQPDEAAWYADDALATAGWTSAGATPNALLGDAFQIEPGVATGGALPGLTFDETLDWSAARTFSKRYQSLEKVTGASAPVEFRFRGDGRTPLGTRLAFRFLADEGMGLRSWLTLWRSDVPATPGGSGTSDLCEFMKSCAKGVDACLGFGFFHPGWRLSATTYDNDSNTVVFFTEPYLYAFLVTQRIDLQGNASLNPGAFLGGWVKLDVRSEPGAGQAYAAVEHVGPAFHTSQAASRLGPPDACMVPKTAQTDP